MRKWHRTKTLRSKILKPTVNGIRNTVGNASDYRSRSREFEHEHQTGHITFVEIGGARWLSGRVSDSRARGRGFETYRRRVVSLSKTLYSPKVLVNYPGSGGSVPI